MEVSSFRAALFAPTALDSSGSSSAEAPVSAPSAEETLESSRQIALAQREVAEIREALTNLDRFARDLRPKVSRAASVTSQATLSLTREGPPLVVDPGASTALQSVEQVNTDVGAPVLVDPGTSTTIRSLEEVNTTPAAPILVDPGTSTELRSVEEVNATTTSFTPTQPGWAGSTAQASIGGTYLGTQGTGTLTFRVQGTGVRGTDNIVIDVLNPAGATFQTITIDKNNPVNQEYVLSNGLNLKLGAGLALGADTFTVNVNAGVPSSYGPSAPAWVGSTASASIGGVYDGSQGTDSLTFRVNQGGTHGTDDLAIKVFNSGGGELQTLNISTADPINTVYTLSSGIELTLSAGALIKDTTFTVDVTHNLVFAVDPSKPLNGTGGDDPMLQAGFVVSDGSFTVNGVSIAVSASDSVDDVLARITASAADVSASFDALTENVVLTAKSPGSQNGVVLANDNSGFLAATKLNSAVAVPGEDPVYENPVTAVDPSKPFNGTGANDPHLDDGFTVGDGSFTLNGVSIAVSASDSIDDVLARITASAAGVSASFDAVTEQVVLTHDTAGAGNGITFSSDSSGFLAATKLAGATAVAGQDPVYQSPDIAVDPSKPLNGTGAGDPMLQGGFAVTAGSFTVNGVSIAVSASDSIDDVLSRITASAAGVSASFDAVTEQVLLTHNTPGADNDIALAGDTSGFLAATKLAGGVAVPGQDPTLLPQQIPVLLDQATLADFVGVSTGTVTVNGVGIPIDAANDSLADVLARISASAAGVQASIGPTQDRLKLVATTKGKAITLDSGDTGFFTSASIDDGVYRARRRGGVSSRRAGEIGKALERVSQAVNELFGDQKNATAPAAVDKVRAAVRSDILGQTANARLSERLQTDFGVEIDFREGRPKVFDFSATKQRSFVKDLRSDPVEIRDFFIGRVARSDDGFVGRLLKVLDLARRDLDGAVRDLGSQGSLGLLVNSFA